MSIEINDALIDKLASLSKLEFNVEERQEVKEDLQKMIAFVEKIEELDTEGVEPLIHMSDRVNVWRRDETKALNTKEEILQNAPLSNNDFFLSPKVLKNK